MKHKTLFKVLIAVLFFVIIIYSFSGGQTTKEYIEEIKFKREEIDIFMRFDEESPFSKNKELYDSLKYYPINSSYKIKANFEEINKKNIIKLSNNDNTIVEYLEYGWLTFKYRDKKQKLLLLENIIEEKLFLAFGDETSALETYGGGRYLDIDYFVGNTVVLDFNLAYNPYCAYSDEYICPLPPRVNLLSIPIQAGEKIFR